MYGNAALVGDKGRPGGANDLCVRPHRATVHYALEKGKCLLHRHSRYGGSMETPNDRLRQARKAKYATQEEAARAFGVKIDTYRQHENDTRGLGGIPRKRAELYAKRLKVSLEWLLTGNGPQDEPDPIPTEVEIQEMLREAMDGVVTVETRLVDLPRIVAPALREQLERYRGDAPALREPASLWDERNARDIASQSHAATRRGEKAG